MQIFAVFDTEGLPKGFYTPVIHSEIPEGSVRITAKQWHEFLANKGKRKWDGEKVVEYFPPQNSGPAFSARLDQLLSVFGVFINRSQRLMR